MDIVIINGEVTSKEKASLTKCLWDEPFIISQKIWFGFGGIPLFKENIAAIEAQLKTFNLQLPVLFQNKRELFRLTKRMLNKNKFYRSGLILCQFYISGTSIQTFISSLGSAEFDFPYSKRGLLVHISEHAKAMNLPLSKYICHNRILWEVVGRSLPSSCEKNTLLLNKDGMVCEGLAANVFMIKDDILVTPSLNAGCYSDILRKLIMEIASSLKLKIVETAELRKEHLFEMDEVFFASEARGLQWVLGIENKRFVHKITDNIYDKLNNYLEHKISD